MIDLDARQFIDTNILIYAHDVSAGARHQQAQDLIETLWNSGAGCLSMQVLQEFYVNVTCKIPHPLSPSDASQIISDLAVWEIHRPNVDDILDAIHLQTEHRISFWDAMIVVSADRLGCPTLWSEDLNTGQSYRSVVVRSPF